MWHWVRPTHRTPHWVRHMHPMPHWGASPHLKQTATDAPNSKCTHTTPAPRYEAPLRSGVACQGIFPALTSHPRPSAQSSFGVPTARQGAMSPPGDEPPKTLKQLPSQPPINPHHLIVINLQPHPRQPRMQLILLRNHLHHNMIRPSRPMLPQPNSNRGNIPQRHQIVNQPIRPSPGQILSRIPQPPQIASVITQPQIRILHPPPSHAPSPNQIRSHHNLLLRRQKPTSTQHRPSRPSMPRRNQIRHRPASPLRSQLQHPRPQRSQHPPGNRHPTRIQHIKKSPNRIHRPLIPRRLLPMPSPDPEHKPPGKLRSHPLIRLSQHRRIPRPHVDDARPHHQRLGSRQQLVNPGQIHPRPAKPQRRIPQLLDLGSHRRSSQRPDLPHAVPTQSDLHEDHRGDEKMDWQVQNQPTKKGSPAPESRRALPQENLSQSRHPAQPPWPPRPPPQARPAGPAGWARSDPAPDHPKPPPRSPPRPPASCSP